MLNPYGTSGFRVTSVQGTRILNGKVNVHNGLDLVGESKNILSICAGTVVQSRIVTDKSNPTWEWGNYVAVQDAASGKLVYYCHLSARHVKIGQSVRRGDLIGVEGSTGYSTGSHLHLEIRSGAVPVSASEFTGIPNVIAAYPAAVPDYRALVTAKTGISEITADYIGAYEYADDLWRKLWLAMETK